MKVVKRTDEYVIYQKQSGRYAVRGKDKRWINGDDKVRILLEHALIETVAPKVPEPEPEESAAEAETAASAPDAAAGDANTAEEDSA